MGNQLIGIAPSQIYPVEHYFLGHFGTEIIFDSNMGSTRFFEVAKAKSEEGLIVVKVSVKHDPTLSLEDHKDCVEYIKKTLTLEEDYNRGVVFGFDGRYNSERFAELFAAINAVNDIVLDVKTRQCSKPSQTLNTVEIGPTIPRSSTSKSNERFVSNSLRKIGFAKLVISSPGLNCVETQK
uniref:Uncharacterized protein n=1 Tax=Glossina austeni TaxID=7395 RepID=A0A1A9VT08_GLOAU